MIYDAVPKRGIGAYDKYAGSHVACWINVEKIEIARQKAVAMIQEQGWKIRKQVEEYSITREMAEQSTGLQYYEQALIDTEVLVFVTSPRKKPK
ncbi:MAG: hypothetical protein PHY43_05415 [Verrucomicrobiales bacterium]|nr:hypothetical protein [Verrucomicrobiales bacterium]